MQDRETYQEYLALKADLAALQFMVALLKRPRIGRKFNVNQPRVPRGSENGGQWTDGSDWGGPSEAVVREGQDTPPGLVRISDRPHVEPPIDIYANRSKPGIGHNGPPSETPPEIPRQEPSRHRTKLRIAREVARWFEAALPILRLVKVAIALTIAIETIAWFSENYYPLIEAYLEPPKSLKQLQDAVRTPHKGTDVHHIVEKNQAEAEGYPPEMINAPENLVRISRFRHWNITTYYQTLDANLGMTPRQHLEGKSWQEKYEFGLKVMEREGVYNGK